VSIPPASEVYMVYQERASDGQGHVLLKKGSDYKGTGDFTGETGWASTYWKF
jgi:hypothetical protein